jgi:hypothetical protein
MDRQDDHSVLDLTGVEEGKGAFEPRRHERDQVASLSDVSPTPWPVSLLETLPAQVFPFPSLVSIPALDPLAVLFFQMLWRGPASEIPPPSTLLSAAVMSVWL